jgi:regulator of replication initiation timing
VKHLTEQTQNAVSPAMQQIGMLNLRINDMMTQLNTVMKMLMQENTTLKKENAELKAKPKETPKTK